ncbi:hypothetical protein EVAR_3031_1 [Eumeta japonica]|uniref:Uncharacterized protein n=1 Tax=Eumeta variegata TaxID=151549 RepID=A0A4C1SWX3_EUMVA|nr:hypothetical protein EVAR_3031_1 [Eumeta japonica]
MSSFTQTLRNTEKVLARAAGGGGGAGVEKADATALRRSRTLLHKSWRVLRLGDNRIAAVRPTTCAGVGVISTSTDRDITRSLSVLCGAKEKKTPAVIGRLMF